jgi:hypothetical protein
MQASIQLFLETTPLDSTGGGKWWLLKEFAETGIAYKFVKN